jgi:hypothetical protein
MKIIAIALIAFGFCAPAVLAAQPPRTMPTLPTNGWSSFDISSVPNAANWCCFNVRLGALACDLDKSDAGFASIDRQKALTSANVVRIFVQTQHGQVRSVRPVGLSCSVKSSTPVQHLGRVVSDVSLEWLRREADKFEFQVLPKQNKFEFQVLPKQNKFEFQVLPKQNKRTTTGPKVNSPGRHISFKSAIPASGNSGSRVASGSPTVDSVLAAIAAHDSKRADVILRKFFAPNRNSSLRKAALFWAGQLRGTAGVELAIGAVQDRSAKIRTHALFVLAQTDDARRAEVLTRAGQNDPSPHVRAQAWFWLAKSSDAKAVNAAKSIRKAALSDQDDNVREQAIFALSQLPKAQSSNALISLLDNRSTPKIARERALFWLAQSEDPKARHYLERVLGN